MQAGGGEERGAGLTILNEGRYVDLRDVSIASEDWMTKRHCLSMPPTDFYVQTALRKGCVRRNYVTGVRFRGYVTRRHEEVT